MNVVEAKATCLGPDQIVLRGSFALPEGKTALLGPNGTGKTTLLHCLQGIPWVQEGTLAVHGKSVADYGVRDLARDVAMVPQELPRIIHLSVQDVVRLGLLAELGWWKTFPEDAEARVEAALQQLRLLPLRHRIVDTLSTGERQKVFLAQALIRQPRLLLLDEPTSHLDPGATRHFWNEIRGVSVSVLVATHDLAYARSHCDWVLALKEGGVFSCGPSTEFFNGENDLRLYD